jgi:hypothetical protein
LSPEGLSRQDCMHGAIIILAFADSVWQRHDTIKPFKTHFVSYSVWEREWVFRQKRLLPEVFMQRTIFRELCGMELGLTSMPSVLSVPWRNSPYVETDVRLKSFLHINNAGREQEHCCEVAVGKEQFTVSQQWPCCSFMHFLKIS